MWRFLKRLFCAVAGHDREMEFIDHKTLDWQFKCRRCGNIVRDIMEAL